HAEHEIGAAGHCLALAALGDDASEEPQITQHTEQRQEGERDEVMRLAAWAAADDLQHLRRLDAIELRPELERRERIEERVVRDLPLQKARRRIEDAKRDPRRA